MTARPTASQADRGAIDAGAGAGARPTTEALFARARAALSRGSLDEAVRLWRGVVALEPDNVAALEALARALRGLGRVAEAEAVLRTALERRPDAARLHLALGLTEMGWGATRRAAASFARAIQLDPAVNRARIGLGRACLAGGDPAAAEAAFREALTQAPEDAAAWVGLGDALLRRGDGDGAREAYDRAVRAAPGDATAQTRLAQARLRQGDYARGWIGYEWRLKLPGRASLDPGLPRWDGRDLSGERLLVRAEGGFSETLHFARLIRALPGASVVFEAPDALVELIRFGLAGGAEVIARGAPLPDDLTCWTPLVSLAGMLGVDGTAIPGRVPYLRPDPARLAQWRRRLRGRLSVGIHWHGGRAGVPDGPRAIPLSAFAPLAEIPGVRLVSLQKGTGREQLGRAAFAVEDFTDELDEGPSAFIDTATVVAALDAVVGPDTALVHLAGALGVPTHVALADPARWHWGPGPSATPWYPAARLYRNPPGAPWDAVFRAIAARLADADGPR